jgi:hypothetical protein
MFGFDMYSSLPFLRFASSTMIEAKINKKFSVPRKKGAHILVFGQLTKYEKLLVWPDGRHKDFSIS